MSDSDTGTVTKRCRQLSRYPDRQQVVHALATFGGCEAPRRRGRPTQGEAGDAQRGKFLADVARRRNTRSPRKSSVTSATEKQPRHDEPLRVPETNVPLTLRRVAERARQKDALTVGGAVMARITSAGFVE